MSLRRAPRGPFQRLADGNRAQRTLGAGQVVGAAPVPGNTGASSQALASVADVTATAWQDDEFTLTADGAQDLDLTYLPVDSSEDVKLRGVGQQRGVDWERSDQTLSILSPMDARDDDVLTVHYQYLTGQPTVLNQGGYDLYQGAYFTATGGAEGPDANRQVTDTVGAGWLRFTNAINSEIGGFLSDDVFASGAAITVEWDYAAHAGDGADGHSIFLFDGSVTPASLAGGSNIGFATVVGGILGIGFDEKGNFNPTNPDYVSIRGPQSGSNAVLTGAAAPEVIDGNDRSNSVHVEVTISAALLVTVKMNFGSGLVTVINAFDASTGVGTPPATYKIGMAGTTGSDNNIHEIRNFIATSGSYSLSISGTGTG